MKIITWNMHFCNFHAFKSPELTEFNFINHLSAWKYMIENVKPDIALLQEVNPVRKYSDNLFFRKSHTSEDDEILLWGTGIYINKKIYDKYIISDITEDLFPKDNKFEGKTVVIKLTDDDKNDIYIISLHTDTKDYSNKSKDIIVDHLKYIFRDEVIQKIGNKFVIGGDFNIDETMYGEKYAPVFNEIYKKDIIKAINCRMQTFFGENCGNQTYFQDDHIFIHKSMSDCLKKSFIWNYGILKQYSDHTIVEVNLK